MKSIEVDVAIVGAGTAGMTAYGAARAAGVHAVLIEGSEYGTTCARVGCMPSKLLSAAAEAAHAATRGAAFGAHVDAPIRIDGRAVMARVKRERDRFVQGVVDEVQDYPPQDRLRGAARFVNERTLAVGDNRRVQARAIVIATGSRAYVPESLRELGDRLVTSDGLFEWDDLPSSVAVLGPGPLGLELGQMLHRLGVRVAVFGRGGGVASISDPAVRAYACASLNEEFMLVPDAHVDDIRRNGHRVAVRRPAAGGAQETSYYDWLLAATGRRPDLAGLSLEQAGVRVDDKGTPVFDARTLQVERDGGASCIFIAGDANAHLPLLHEAADEGRIAGSNAARLARGEAVEPGLRRARLAVVFTDPQIAVIGPGYRGLEEGRYAVGRASFENQGRARILLRNKGLLHVYGELGTGRFLGAEMFAPAAEHLAHLLAWALQSGMTVRQMLEMPFYHPVIEEGIRTALADLQREIRAAS